MSPITTPLDRVPVQGEVLAEPSPQSMITLLFKNHHPRLAPGSFPPASIMASLINATFASKVKVAVIPTRVPAPTAILLSNIAPENGDFICTSITRVFSPTGALDPVKGRYKRLQLGSGACSTVYQGNLLRASARDSSVTEMPVAVSKTKLAFFNRDAFALLKRVPPSPYLCARPRYFYQRHQKYIYAVMPLLKEGGDLLNLIIANQASPLKSLRFLLTGCKNTALAAALLHSLGIIHGDIKLENMCLEGLFDYDSLRTEGFDRLRGAAWDLCAPEFLLYCANALRPLLEKEGMPEGRLNQVKASLVTIEESLTILTSWHGKEALEALSLTLPPPEYDATGYYPLIPHTKAGDVYLLGKQLVRFYGKVHPSTWSFMDENPTLVELKNHVLRMIHLEPSERPSMEECAAFFEGFLRKLSPAS